MNDIKLVYLFATNDAKYFILSIIVYQIISIYIYNFMIGWTRFDAFRNAEALFDIVLVLITPYIFTKNILENKSDQSRSNGIMLGLITNSLLLCLFLIFGILDFFIKFLLVNRLATLDNLIVTMGGSILGSVIILICGCFAGLFAQRKSS